MFEIFCVFIKHEIILTRILTISRIVLMCIYIYLLVINHLFMFII